MTGKEGGEGGGTCKVKKNATIGTSIPSYMPCMSFLVFEAFFNQKEDKKTDERKTLENTGPQTHITVPHGLQQH